MKRKVLHLENKVTGEHKYYGSLVALCQDNENISLLGAYESKHINTVKLS